MAEETSILDPAIARSFGCAGPEQRLEGGQGTSVRIDDCVFKPVDNVPLYNWSSALLQEITPLGFRVPEPRRSSNGTFVYRGWSAATFEPGEHVAGLWREKLLAARGFHRQIGRLRLNPLPERDDRWSRAHEMAWQLAPLPAGLHPSVVDKINALFAEYGQLRRSDEIIHSDVCGNVLFQDELNPCLIDFSPAYGSPEYGDAILVADAIAWEAAPVGTLKLLPATEHCRQHVLRAIAFRLIVSAIYEPISVQRFVTEYTAFSPAIEAVLSGTEWADG